MLWPKYAADNRSSPPHGADRLSKVRLMKVGRLQLEMDKIPSKPGLSSHHCGVGGH